MITAHVMASGELEFSVRCVVGSFWAETVLSQAMLSDEAATRSYLTALLTDVATTLIGAEVEGLLKSTIAQLQASRRDPAKQGA